MDASWRPAGAPSGGAIENVRLWRQARQGTPPANRTGCAVERTGCPEIPRAGSWTPDSAPEWLCNRSEAPTRNAMVSRRTPAVHRRTRGGEVRLKAEAMAGESPRCAIVRRALEF